ncbi:hypothetical protein JW935_20060 [candidate division KSB1 bacterium]|nr:hypothetical protein [candidate division KSB1 bacterium]
MRFIIVNIIVFFSWSFLPAQTGLQRCERNLEHIQTRIDSVNAVLSENIKTSDSLAQQTAQLRATSSLSFFERRRLEGLLKRSQALSKQQEQAVVFLNGLSEDKQQKQIQLEHLYDSAIDSLMSEIRRGRGKNPRIKVLADQVRQLQLGRQNIRAGTPAVQPADRGPLLEQNDMPEDIQAKADFYRDRIDRYRAKAEELEQRIARVRDESKLRRRMSEMVSDVRLFDQRDEAFTPKTGQAPAPDDKNGIADGVFGDQENWRNSEFMGGVSNTTDLNQADQYLKFDFYSLPSYDVDVYLTNLEREKARLLTAADSMSAVIADYEEQARILRQSLTEPE